MSPLTPAKNIADGLTILRGKVISLSLDAEGLHEDGRGDQAASTWAEHHRLQAVVFRCESLWRAGDCGTLHALLFAEGINVSGKKRSARG